MVPIQSNNYASSSSVDAYSDRLLTPNFELWVEIFCVPTCFYIRIPKPCLSVCPYVRPSVSTPQKVITQASFVTLVIIDTKIESPSRVIYTAWNSPPPLKKFEIEFWLMPKNWNNLNFVHISPTLVIVHQWKSLHEYYNMETHNILLNRNWILTCAEEMKSP